MADHKKIIDEANEINDKCIKDERKEFDKVKVIGQECICNELHRTPRVISKYKIVIYTDIWQLNQRMIDTYEKIVLWERNKSIIFVYRNNWEITMKYWFNKIVIIDTDMNYVIQYDPETNELTGFDEKTMIKTASCWEFLPYDFVMRNNADGKQYSLIDDKLKEFYDFRKNNNLFAYLPPPLLKDSALQHLPDSAI
jgi:hypothetical protein